MEFMRRDVTDHLSYYIKPGGDVTAVMPNQDDTFTLRFIQDFVGPTVEVVCYTQDGYALIRNMQADLEGLPINDLATAVVTQSTGTANVVRGRAFLIHPDHFDRRVVPAA